MNKFHFTNLFCIISILCTVNCIAISVCTTDNIVYSFKYTICPISGYYSLTIGTMCPKYGYSSPFLGHTSPGLRYYSPTIGTRCPKYGYASPGLGHNSPDLCYLSKSVGHYTTYVLAIFPFMGDIPFVVGAVPP